MRCSCACALKLSGLTAQGMKEEALVTINIAVQMFELMSRQAEQPEFLQTLTDAQKNARQTAGQDACTRQQHGNEVLQESWWQVPAQLPCTSASEEASIDTEFLKDFTEVCGHEHSSMMRCRFSHDSPIHLPTYHLTKSLPEAQSLPEKCI